MLISLWGCFNMKEKINCCKCNKPKSMKSLKYFPQRERTQFGGNIVLVAGYYCSKGCKK